MALTVGEAFGRFYSWMMPFLKSLVSTTAKEDRLLRGKALECISLVGMAVGKDMFR